MKIEVGKYYRTRDGRKVGPMGLWKDGKFDCEPSWAGKFWTEDGKSGGGNWGHYQHDLIAEWQESGPTLSGETIDQIAIDSLKFHFDQDLEPLQYEAFRIVLRHYGVSMP